MVDLVKLEELAKAATPGPWETDGAACPYKHGDSFSECGANITKVGAKYSDPEIVVGGLQDEQGGGVGVLKNEDAAFIAAANPATVLELIAALTSAKAEIERLKEAARTACMIHIEHACARYILASVGDRANGALKATHHMEICQYLTAAFTGKVDPDRVYQWHPFYKELHDSSQKFTSRLKDDMSNEAIRDLARKFVDLAVEISARAAAAMGEEPRR